MIKILFNLYIFISTLFVVFYTVNFNSHYGYEYIWILPLSYLILYFISAFNIKNYNNIFIFFLVIILYLRYVILTFLLVYTSFTVERAAMAPSVSSYDKAVILMTIEMIVIFCMINFVIAKINLSTKLFNIKPILNSKVYIIFIFASIALFLIQPALWSRVSFIVPQNVLVNNELSSLGSITYFSLYVSKYLLIGVITSKLFLAYNKSKSRIYIFLNYILVIMISLIIFGHNRADFLISFLAVLFLLQIIYKKRAYIYSFFSIILAPMIIILITQSREDISAENNLPFLESITNTLQAYLGGIYNVAIAIETRDYYSDFINIQNIIYDIFRSFLGLNIFVRNMDAELTNHLFNYRMYGTGHVSQILPSVGQGYFYFGSIFSPIFTVLMILIAIYLMKKIVKLQRIDIVLFLLIPIFRLTLSPVQNISILMNDMSSILVIFLPLYMLSKKILSSKIERKDSINESNASS